MTEPIDASTFGVEVIRHDLRIECWSSRQREDIPARRFFASSEMASQCFAPPDQILVAGDERQQFSPLDSCQRAPTRVVRPISGPPVPERKGDRSQYPGLFRESVDCLSNAPAEREVPGVITHAQPFSVVIVVRHSKETLKKQQLPVEKPCSLTERELRGLHHRRTQGVPG